MTARHAVLLLGGSFDPIHNGHLALARAAQAAFAPDAVVRLVPAGQPWQKTGLGAARDREAMVRLAIGELPGLVLDSCELQRAGASYTIDTVTAMRAALDPATPIVLVIGMDQWRHFASWHRWQELLDLAHVAVACRAGDPAPLPAKLASRWQRRQPAQSALDAPGGLVVEVSMLPVAWSSSQVRVLLATPASPERDLQLREALPLPVLDYIQTHHLYGIRNGST